VTTAKHSGSESKILKYSEMIMPLMFETWMELKPTVSKTIDGEMCSSMSLETSIMLRIVMDIIMELYQMVADTGDEAKLKFLNKTQEKFEIHLVQSFPYTQDDASKKTPESGGGKCLYQNISIAILFLTFTARNRQRFWKHREKIFKFFEDCVVNWKGKDQELNRLMKKFIRLLFTPEMRSIFVHESRQIFTQLIKKCNVDQSSYDPKLALVCEIIEGGKKDSIYAELVPQMVQVLSSREFVPVHIIRTVSTLAKQGNQTVFEDLQKTAVEIVKNLLGPMKISGNLSGDSIKWKKEIANLIYWVESRDVLASIKSELKSDELSNYTREIVDMKLN
jgi:pre-rRNA-processing protein IPI1